MLVMTEPRISEEAFTRILTDAQSPLAPDAAQAYRMIKDYGLDPAFALALYRKESSYGTAGVAIDTKNFGNVRTPYTPSLAIGAHPRGFAIYASWLDSLRDWCLRILNRYIRDEKLITVRAIIERYAPAFENDTNLYVHQVEQWVTEWQENEMSKHDVTWVGMTTHHYTSGGNQQRAVVLHSTAGRYPGDYHWLRQGGQVSAPVSIHYYIRKNGEIYQMVQDRDIAWHCGESTWIVDGRQIPYGIGLNPYSIGIELENQNTGADPYPAAQIDAAVWLTRALVDRYTVPQSQLVRHADIAPSRKTDPRGLDWPAFVARVYDQDPPEVIYRAPHWHEVHGGGTTNVRYQPHVSEPPELNIAMQLKRGRMHIERWTDEDDPDYGGRWGNISGSDLWVHSTGVRAE